MLLKQDIIHLPLTMWSHDTSITVKPKKGIVLPGQYEEIISFKKCDIGLPPYST